MEAGNVAKLGHDALLLKRFVVGLRVISMITSIQQVAHVWRSL